MIKTVFLVLILAIGFISCDEDDLQRTDVPSIVANSFSEKFPNAKNLEWEKRANTYEAEFEVQNVEYETILNADGSIEKYKHELGYEELPEAVKDTISAEFNKTKIDDIELLEISENTYYQVEFDEELNDKNVIFEETGAVNSGIIW